MVMVSKGPIHFVGIGGIGMSALARLYRSRGFRISGSDLERSEITDALGKDGIRVFTGKHTRANIAHSATGVVYTAAVRRENPEIREAKRRHIPVHTYAQALGELTRACRTIAVAGAHGKSTTTALIALTLIRGGLDPTVIVGTKLREFRDSNFRRSRPPHPAGPPHSKPWLVIEADEYRGSFWNHSPEIAVVTNIDREHLDFYKNIKNIEAAFLKFLLRLAPKGVAVLNRDDRRLRRAATRLRRPRPDIRIVWFSLRDAEAGRIAPRLRVPGRHNVSNALAAYRVGRALNIPSSKIMNALSRYRGAWRRFDYQGTLAGAKVYADYAHHPTEIKATLQAAREHFPKRRIICVFQPHHYERMRDLWREFVGAFDDCNGLILLDIYEVAGREHKRRSGAVSSARLAEAISRRGTPALYIPDSRRLNPFFRENLRRGDVLLMMGAGDIWETTKRLMAHHTN